ncbi:MAG TPA: segregation/condensation protein A [Acidimicrobiia bacterium]|nr:segregation/condensation protein A [Acidimicrobiia bacterium]
MPYEVSTSVFEGPFDLLLHLILKEEVDLWEISLERIVDAFCAEVERMEHLDLEVTTEFLLIAATLVELKSRRLLPGRDDIDLDEELMRFEERDLLLARLLECKTFQDAATVLRDRLLEASRSVARRAGPEEPLRSLAPDPLERLPLDQFVKAARRALAPKPAEVHEVRTDHVAPIRASVRDAIETVLALLPEHGAVTLRELTYGVREKLEVIVRFLAVLELFKQGVVDLDQIGNFGELRVRPLAPGERVALDLSSLEEWGDDVPASPVPVEEHA